MLENFFRYCHTLFIVLLQEISMYLSQRIFQIKTPPLYQSLWKFQVWLMLSYENFCFRDLPSPFESVRTFCGSSHCWWGYTASINKMTRYNMLQYSGFYTPLGALFQSCYIYVTWTVSQSQITVLIIVHLSFSREMHSLLSRSPSGVWEKYYFNWRADFN